MAPSPPLRALGDSLIWSYANLGMAHAAVSMRAEKYERLHYMIRSRLHKRNLSIILRHSDAQI
jgi:hypothetical protein